MTRTRQTIQHRATKFTLMRNLPPSKVSHEDWNWPFFQMFSNKRCWLTSLKKSMRRVWQSYWSSKLGLENTLVRFLLAHHEGRCQVIGTEVQVLLEALPCSLAIPHRLGPLDQFVFFRSLCSEKYLIIAINYFMKWVAPYQHHFEINNISHLEINHLSF